MMVRACVSPARSPAAPLLPEPWSAVTGLVALALFGFEVFYFYRRMRGVKVATGVENLVGAVGTTVEPLDPEATSASRASFGKHALPRQYRRARSPRRGARRVDARGRNRGDASCSSALVAGRSRSSSLPSSSGRPASASCSADTCDTGRDPAGAVRGPPGGAARGRRADPRFRACARGRTLRVEAGSGRRGREQDRHDVPARSDARRAGRSESLDLLRRYTDTSIRLSESVPGSDEARRAQADGEVSP